MFSRSALARAFALPLEQAARPSLITSTTFRACLHQATSTTSTPSSEATTNPPEPLSAIPRAQSSTPRTQAPPKTPINTIPTTRADIPASKQPIAPTFTTPLTVSKSLLDTLPLLAEQKPHYITAHLHDRPYLLTEGDHLRLPFLMPKVQPGDVLRFNRASLLGSRDFTLKGKPYIDERLFECRLRVLGVDAEPLRVKEKTKRRRRHVQRITSKHRYTLLRVMEVKVKSREELEREGPVVVEE
ncbi:ribosomal protein L21-like protein [Aspergillus karnatakaensis]|uniref:mitochondrial 54S ribosomal protein bL21m n=1 Tax=Aspergillus karnatakaensis TaxID=1810916 RepID=UPI003CCDC478